MKRPLGTNGLVSDKPDIEPEGVVDFRHSILHTWFCKQYLKIRRQYNIIRILSQEANFV